jgi:hypothetical protein
LENAKPKRVTAAQRLAAQLLGTALLLALPSLPKRIFHVRVLVPP